jgi:hypothetical protein
VTSPSGHASHLVLRLCACLLLATVLTATGVAPAALAAPPYKEKPYAVIFGTVWGPDDHPAYGIKVKIRRAKDKRAKWELYSDHNGEFEQRVPAGEADYVIWADLKGVKTLDGKPLQAKEVTVHVYNDEREDTGLHLTE